MIVELLHHPEVPGGILPFSTHLEVMKSRAFRVSSGFKFRRKKKENRIREIFEVRTAKNFPKLLTDTKLKRKT